MTSVARQRPRTCWFQLDEGRYRCLRCQRTPKLALFSGFWHTHTPGAAHRRSPGTTPQPHTAMRFVSLLLAHAVAAIVATRGDGNAAGFETRRSTTAAAPRVTTTTIQGSCCNDVPTLASPHGKGAPDRSPAPAVPSSSSRLEARELASRGRTTTATSPTSPRLHFELEGLTSPAPPLGRLLRGGSTATTRRDEKRASEEHQRVRNVLLYYPNLIGEVFDGAMHHYNVPVNAVIANRRACCACNWSTVDVCV